MSRHLTAQLFPVSQCNYRFSVLTVVSELVKDGEFVLIDDIPLRVFFLHNSV